MRATILAAIIALVPCLLTAGELSDWIATHSPLSADDDVPVPVPIPEPAIVVASFPSPCIVFFTQSPCPPCDEAKVTIVPWVERAGWEVVYVDTDDDPATADAYEVESTPTLLVIRNGEECGRSVGPDFKQFERVLREACGCNVSTTVDTGYPVEQQDWNFSGDMHPSRETMIQHLLTGAEHRGEFAESWLRTLSREQLASLHDADHEHRVQRQYVQQPTRRRVYCPT